MLTYKLDLAFLILALITLHAQPPRPPAPPELQPSAEEWKQLSDCVNAPRTSAERKQIPSKDNVKIKVDINLLEPNITVKDFTKKPTYMNDEQFLLFNDYLNRKATAPEERKKRESEYDIPCAARVAPDASVFKKFWHNALCTIGYHKTVRYTENDAFADVKELIELCPSAQTKLLEELWSLVSYSYITSFRNPPSFVKDELQATKALCETHDYKAATETIKALKSRLIDLMT